jgi:hypothetical protein
MCSERRRAGPSLAIKLPILTFQSQAVTLVAATAAALMASSVSGNIQVQTADPLSSFAPSSFEERKNFRNRIREEVKSDAERTGKPFPIGFAIPGVDCRG